MNKFKAVIFDMDGVILDSERIYMECCMEVGEKYGAENIEETCLSCIGLNTERTLARFEEIYGKDFPLSLFWEEATSRFTEKAQSGLLPVKKGARELLDYLKNKNVLTALASSTKYEKVCSELTAAGLIDYFDVIVGGDMVEKSKPEPDIFIHAANRLGVQAKDCCIIEDSINGITAACASGAFVIMVPDLVYPTDLDMDNTDCVLPSLVDVREYSEETEKGVYQISDRISVELPEDWYFLKQMNTGEDGGRADETEWDGSYSTYIACGYQYIDELSPNDHEYIFRICDVYDRRSGRSFDEFVHFMTERYPRSEYCILKEISDTIVYLFAEKSKSRESYCLKLYRFLGECRYLYIDSYVTANYREEAYINMYIAFQCAVQALRVDGKPISFSDDTVQYIQEQFEKIHC